MLKLYGIIQNTIRDNFFIKHKILVKVKIYLASCNFKKILKFKKEIICMIKVLIFLKNFVLLMINQIKDTRELTIKENKNSWIKIC